MTPDEINTQFGKPVWTCYGCKGQTGLHWWNGLSVAVCQTSECSKKYVEHITRQAEEEQWYEEYLKENAP